MQFPSTGVGDEDGRLVVGPKRACVMLDCGITRLYEMIAAGELASYKVRQGSPDHRGIDTRPRCP